MRIIQWLIFSVLLFSSSWAQAGYTLAASAGSGYQWGDSHGRLQTNIMLAPGVSFLQDYLRFEVGFVADLPDVKEADFNLQVRPMLVIAPPIIPLYVRLVAGVTQIVSGPTGVAFGGALGTALRLGPLSLFAEAGYIPRAIHGDISSAIEGRLGGTFFF